MLQTWASVQKELESFRRYLAPDFPPFKILHGFDVINLEGDWKWGIEDKQWSRSGEYLAYDDEGKLIYVGKATATFNKRIKKQGYEVAGAAHFAIIPIPDDVIFIAHALESFLIGRLKPRLNKCGKYCDFP